MNDGHTGIENKKVNEGGSDPFKLVLSYLKQANGQIDFIIHATSLSSYMPGLNPFKFLGDIGFFNNLSKCTFFDNACFYRIIATIWEDPRGFEDENTIERIHAGFINISNRINELFLLKKQEDQILRGIGVELPDKHIFGPPIKIEINEKNIPKWINNVKFPGLLKLELEKSKIQTSINELNEFLPLIFGTGDLLVNAVIYSLRYFGLNAELTEKGFTADILAQTKNGKMKFGVEVTGVSGSINKSSKKLTQLLDFDIKKENNEKTILVANTYNTTPIPERKALEHFTTPVVEFLEKHPILLITGWELYLMVEDIMEGSKTKEEIIEILYNKNGKLNYKKNII